MFSLSLTDSQSSYPFPVSKENNTLVDETHFIHPTVVPPQDLENVVCQWFQAVPKFIHLGNSKDGKEVKLPLEYLSVHSNQYSWTNFRGYPDKKVGLWENIDYDSEGDKDFWKQSTVTDIMHQYLLNAKKIHGGVNLNFRFQIECDKGKDKERDKVISQWMEDQREESKLRQQKLQELRKQDPFKIVMDVSRPSNHWTINISSSDNEKNSIQLLPLPYQYALNVQISIYEKEDGEDYFDIQVKYIIAVDIPVSNE
jgi:hypothetical protein